MDNKKRLQEEMKHLTGANWAILDCEVIHINSEHGCIRKLYALSEDGFTDMLQEFRPCVPYFMLEDKFKKTYRYCFRNVHGLRYKPNQKDAPFCCKVVEYMDRFIRTNNINLILYKGGNIEKLLSQKVGINSYNIEIINAPKVPSHDPVIEVHNHYNYLKTINIL